ncbi:MAG: hypothetical protein NTW96_11305 [Planctomycetia bacterium]|nr:hypothetical protein [Planctomycetia bacterium]
MLFTSHIFVYYFLPLLLLVYYNFPHRGRNLLLTAMSYVFYGWWNPYFTSLMLFSTVLNFLCGKVIAMPGARPGRRKAALAASIVVNLGLLGFF